MDEKTVFRIKICGITHPEDAQAAVRAGADAIGLNFVAGSPRCVDVPAAQAVCGANLAPAIPVGVFMDAAVSDILATASAISVTTVQLHGDEPADTLQALAPLRVIKALPVRDEAIYDQINLWSAAGIAAILLDKPRTARNSDPRPMPWHLLRPEAIQRHCGTTAPLILAGGLTPDNVAEALRIVQPHGVDVSSGVESSPGIKDHNLIQRFVLSVRGAMHPGAGC